MAASDDIPLSSADRLMSRYHHRYIFGKRLLLVSKVIQILGWILLAYFVFLLLSTIFRTGNVLAAFEVFFSAPLFFLKSGATFWLISLFTEGFVYVLFSVLEIAVNGATELNEEQKSKIKELAKH